MGGCNPKQIKDDAIKEMEAGRLVSVLSLACCLALGRTGMQGKVFGLLACFGALCNLFGVLAINFLVIALRPMPDKHVIKFFEAHDAYISIVFSAFLAGVLLLGTSL